MIKLSERLERIANLINQNETMADIGTDHGFLPVSLWERGLCSKVILSDINKGPLEKARKNIEMSNPGLDFDLRLGNGLETLEEGEVDTIVIAGMGGVLMTEILGHHLNKSKSFKKIILQPRNGQEKLRFWLNQSGFQIVREELVREGGKICEIILAQPLDYSKEGVSLTVEFELIAFELPNPGLLKDSPLIREFILNKLKIEKNIIERISRGQKSESIINSNKIEVSKKRIAYMKEYLRKLEG